METDNMWVSIKDMNQREILCTAEQITDAGVANSNVKRQPPGTILLSFKLTIGRVALAGRPLYTNEAIAGLRPRKILPEYLYHGLQQWNLLQDVDQAIKGATLNKAKLERIEFTLPESRVEQEMVAAILSLIERGIEQTEALVAKQQRILAGLMQDLLSRGIDDHGNLRSEHTHEFKDSPLGRVPVDWDAVPLASVADVITSGSRGWAQYYSSDGAIFLRIGNLTRDHINLRLDAIVRVSPPALAEGQRTVVRPRDLLISITADLGIIGVVPDAFDVAYVNQHIALVRLSPLKAHSRFLGWFLSGRGGQRQFERFNESGAKAGLNLPTIGQLIVPTMTQSEQERIAGVLDSAANSISEGQRRVEKLHRLRNGLMQNLLTGRKRVTPLLVTSERSVEQLV
jgi:type I restriction enzyme S subunit